MKNKTSIFASFAPDDGKGGKPEEENPEQKMIRIVNAAVSSQMERKLPNAITSAVTAAMAPALEKLTAAAAAPPPGTPPVIEPGAGDSALQAQIDALTQANADKDKEAKANTKRHREEQVNAQIREGLSALKVKPELMDGAVLALRGKMKIDEETGAVAYINKKNGWDESLTMADGLKQWGESDVGKAHMAPLNGGGAGTAPIGPLSSRINPASLPSDPAARKRAIKDHKIAEAKKNLRTHTANMLSGGRVAITGAVEE